MLSIARNIDENIKIMADLQGKKIRIDEKLKETFKIYTNEIVYFVEMMLITYLVKEKIKSRLFL